MVNYFIYAKNFGSIMDNPHFHTYGLKTLEDFKIDVEKIKKELLIAGEPPTESKIIYLHWGGQCYEVDEDIIRIAYNELKNEFNKKPDTIIKWIQQNYDICRENNKIKLLYIIMEGNVDISRPEICITLNENMYYERVVFHAFNEELNESDFSVAASFFKGHCMIYRNYILCDNIDISEQFDYDKINVDNFITEKEHLNSYIKLHFIKKPKYCILHEMYKLQKLRDRLFLELESKSQKINLDTKDKKLFLREFVKTDWYLFTVEADDLKVEIKNFVLSLNKYIDHNEEYYCFVESNVNTSPFSEIFNEDTIIIIGCGFKQKIELPDIILDADKEVPVIILAKLNLMDRIVIQRTILSDKVSPASFAKFNTTMECPLFLVKDPDISESIGYYYTLTDYKQLLANGTTVEPRTRKFFHGGLVLTDTDQFDEYNDYILSATYFNSKNMYYNSGLFYFVLWKNCENKEWMDKNVVEQFKKYAMRRISKTVCEIGLSSFAPHPREKTSLLTALWYCVELSSCIFKDDSKHFMHERLPMFHGVADYIIEILQYFNYDLDLESIKERTDLNRHVMKKMFQDVKVFSRL